MLPAIIPTLMATPLRLNSLLIYPSMLGITDSGFVDYNCRDAPLYDGCGGGVGKTFPCGGYPPDTQVVQSFQAGQVINVRFGNAQFGSPGQPPLTPGSNQARHAGGLCEFSLSYDQGRTFGVFARYHGSCPDMYYDWPVKLPENLPSCESCIFGKTILTHGTMFTLISIF